ncbi:MAG: hypothetical protein KGI97_03385, partial [Alphaproteobacteria bacterium]|nr:hypothetical protein [Alphaproteobacteria bacterium]
MMSDIFFSKLDGVPLKNIFICVDYDLTLANKDPKNFDDAPLTTEQYKGLHTLCTRIGRFVIVTARGEKSILQYLGAHIGDHGRLPNISLASNSGHMWHKLDEPQKRHIIQIPGYSKGALTKTVDSIYGIIGALKEKYPDIGADYRELCGAVVYQFPGKP